MVELNGKQYPLRFTVNAVCQMEKETGMPLGDVLRSDLSCVRALLYAGLYEQEGLSMKETGELLDKHLKNGGSLKRVADAIARDLDSAGFFHRQRKGV